MKSIETGVDKLVNLIEDKKRISLEDAAKKLGVSTVLVQEWADFLEEDGIISIEYSLSKVWLVERKLSKTEVEKKTKEYENKKESFIRKVETTLNTLDSDTIGFEKMKKEFGELKKELGTELDYVKKDLKELEYYENLKNNIDKDIEKQKSEYQKLMEQSHQQIRAEERRYQDMIFQIGRERDHVDKDKERVKKLEEQEKILQEKIDSMTELVADTRKKIREENHDLEISEQNLKKIEIFVEQIERRIKGKKQEAILPLIKLSETHRNKILNLQDQILEKLKEKKKEIDEYKGHNKKVTKNLKTFFDKKGAAEKLLKKVDDEKKKLEKEYEQLIKKAQAFNAISKDATVKKHMAALQKDYDKIEKHKTTIKDEIKKLTKLVKG